MDEMREKFSEHCQLWRYSEEVDENDFFVNATTQRAWDVWGTAWQASRQALVVQLPENGEPVFKNDFAEGVSSGADIYRSAVEYALDKQGIKYK